MNGSDRTERARERLGRACAVVLLLAGLLLAAREPAAAEGEYRLGPEDKIRLKVFEWRASQDEVFGWEALNDEYSLGAAGELSLPLVGSVQAAGATRDQLAKLISERLAQNMGLGRAPSVAVEIVAYRPFFIVGPVETPGAYPYRPGLTLLKALSLAGGLKTSEDGGARAVISGLGDLDVLLLQRDEVVAKLARLRAEMSGADFEAPPGLAARKGDAAVARLIAQEQAIFAARQEAFSTQMAALEQLRTNLQTEVPAQAALLDNVKAQADSLRDEVATIGKVVTGREVRDLERQITALEGQRLQGETSLLRAQQEVSRAEIAIIELRSQRTQSLAGEIRDTQGQFDQLERRIDTATSLVEDAEISSPLDGEAGRPRLRPLYSIVRAGADGQPVEFEAEETTQIEPGDAIKVELRRGQPVNLSGEI
ncbi:MAG TPA: polysaccharide biosynthesis/export family protein [Amaricoccus sp.]|uniref:polysaccharide biosynthesis/export family protein n=1 Tax=Amaricoccus sp. TaxID=1872485 RepID=UPI002BF21172|nr:polysaccharide biosynthesis/export family protein [Amaricoccus sp.]HMQ92209.1 polysaccharide biosynthesis/export family protein [Amaricoccus sp.]HMR51665.1 polysaccharide biosynthesis/export family protein [Amaricoccus sp.]HMR59056.1 polysaccharide biosynthesis/export family protein [Amaricoccus sp.]HMT98399.1 polysaccharide biosynthesis/export family protein [Amaricoccus sp.]